MGNGSSSWRGRAIDRRNERQARDEVRPQSGSSKDTKRWCRGVVGREHLPTCVDFADVKGEVYRKYGWKVLRCSVCSKHLDYYWPSPFRKEKPPAPAWVTGGDVECQDDQAGTR